jgi:hypothetical protein
MKMKSKKNLQTLLKFSQIVFLTAFITTPAHAIKFHGPIVVDDAYIRKHGNVISGNYQGTNTEAAVTIVTPANVTITNSTLSGPSDLIQAVIDPANVTVTNTTGIGTNPNVRGVQKGIFLHVDTFSSITMQNNTIQGMRLGFFCNGYDGDLTTDNTLVIDNNVFTNVDARPSDGKGAYETTGQYNGQAVHLGYVNGVPGMDIGWNEVMNTANQSSTGVLIEINESGGTSSSPMSIHDNFISGAFPSYPGRDLYAFGGIEINGAVDDSPASASAYINITNNRVVATANFGIRIAAGNNITATANRVVSSGFLTTGGFYPMSTYGDAFGAVNANIYNQPATVFFNNNFSNNILGLIKNNGSKQPVRSDWSLDGQGGSVNGNTNYLPNDSADPTIADEQQEFIDWQNSNLAHHITVGAK